MKPITAIRGLVLAVALVALSGCATYPISKNLREQAKPLTLAQVSTNLAAYTGTVVIWGGRVIQTVNDTNGGSIYVLKLPLTRDGRPQFHGVSTGRFIARSKGYVDPEEFRRGRLITVAGKVEGAVKEPVQKIEYTYPVVSIDELHLWHFVPEPYYYYPDWYWGWYGPPWNRDWYGPGWGWGWYQPGWIWDWNQQ